MHIADFSVGMLGANGVVAAGMPIAVGAAHAASCGRDAMAVCFFGDGAINRGPFAESAELGDVFGLPVLFVCEDNRWSATTATGALTAGEGAAARAGVRHPGGEVDGNDVEAVDAAAARWSREVRAGIGPAAAACAHLSLQGPCVGRPGRLPRPGRTGGGAARRSVAARRARLPACRGAAATSWQARIERAAREEVGGRGGLGRCRADWPADAVRAFTEVQTTGGAAMAMMSYAAWRPARRWPHATMRADARVVALGEDVGRGGIFGQYRGLRAFGAERVIDTPISESTSWARRSAWR